MDDLTTHLHQNPKNGALRYLIGFFLIFLMLCGLYFYHVSTNSVYFVSYINSLALSLCVPFSKLDSMLQCQDNTFIYNNAPSMAVAPGCDGLAFMILLLASILPYSQSLIVKLKGVLVLVPLILAINWLRILVLAIFQFYFPAYFHFVHIYLFQPLMIVATIVCFLLWINYSDQTPAPVQ